MPIGEKHHQDNAGPGHAIERTRPKNAEPERNPLRSEGFYEAMASLLNEISNDIETMEEMLAPILTDEGTVHKEPTPSIPSPETYLERKREEVLERFLKLRSELKILKSKIKL